MKMNNNWLWLFLAFFWTVIISSFAWQENKSNRDDIMAFASAEALASYNKDLAYRRWATSHGGVYVPTTKETPPNVYLKNTLERDIETPSGRKLTLVNPAYMTRQVHDLAKEQYGVKGHITSLNPLRPENKPDAWETEALRSFEDGKAFAKSEYSIGSESYLRMMFPMVAEEGCLICHTEQGYNLGDIRGGISVSVPLKPYLTIYHATQPKRMAFHAGIWLLGMIALLLTRRKLNQQFLVTESSKYLLEKAQQLGLIGSWEFDIVKNILVWTDENCRLFGVPSGSILNYEVFAEKVHPEDREYVDQEWSAALQGMPYDIEYRIVIAGETKWVRGKAEIAFDSDGRAVSAIGFTQDISERRQIEEKLKMSQRLLEETGRIGKVGGWEFNIDTGQQKWTEEVYRIHEVSLDYEPTVEKGLDFYTPDSKLIISTAVQRTIESGEPFDFDLKIITAQGNLRNIHAIGNSDLKNRRVYGFFQDITERKQAQKKLQRMEKLESVGLLAGGIAHDFNNILTGLSGNIALAKMKLPGDHPVVRFLDATEQPMQRAILLTNQLLTFSKGGAPVKESLSLKALVEDSFQLNLFGSNVKPVVTLADNLWLAKADHRQIQQVFAALTTHAKQAMPDGGHLIVTIENVEVADQEILSLEGGKYLRFTMTDEGSGIASEYLEKIFDPYFATNHTGKGLGLAAAHSIINKHGGHISVTSQLGKGTTFTLYLPATEVTEETPLQQYEITPELFIQGAKILVMDDEEMIRNMLNEMLGELGCTVQAASDGQQAIDIYSQAMNDGQPFDAVILDLTIPAGMGGQDAAKGILQINPQARLIVSSGYADDPVMANSADYGFKGVASKPYSLNKLSVELSRVLGNT